MENKAINPEEAWQMFKERKAQLMASTQNRIKEIRHRVGELNREEEVLLELLKKNS